MIKLLKLWNHKLNILLGCDTYNAEDYLND